MVIKAANHLQPGQDAINPIETAAGGLSIKVAARDNGRQIRIGAWPAGKNIAHLIDRDSASCIAAPPDKKIPRLAVEIRQGQPAGTPFIGRADFGHLHYRIPQAPPVNHRLITHASFLLFVFLSIVD